MKYIVPPMNSPLLPWPAIRVGWPAPIETSTSSASRIGWSFPVLAGLDATDLAIDDHAIGLERILRRATEHGSRTDVELRAV